MLAFAHIFVSPHEFPIAISLKCVGFNLIYYPSVDCIHSKGCITINDELPINFPIKYLQKWKIAKNEHLRATRKRRTTTNCSAIEMQKWTKAPACTWGGKRCERSERESEWAERERIKCMSMILCNSRKNDTTSAVYHQQQPTDPMSKSLSHSIFIAWLSGLPRFRWCRSSPHRWRRNRKFHF